MLQSTVFVDSDAVHPVTCAGKLDLLDLGAWSTPAAARPGLGCFWPGVLRGCPCALTSDHVRIAVPFGGNRHEMPLGRSARVARRVNAGSRQRCLGRTWPDCRAEDVARLR